MSVRPTSGRRIHAQAERLVSGRDRSGIAARSIASRDRVTGWRRSEPHAAGGPCGPGMCSGRTATVAHGHPLRSANGACRSTARRRRSHPIAHRPKRRRGRRPARARCRSCSPGCDEDLAEPPRPPGPGRWPRGCSVEVGRGAPAHEPGADGLDPCAEGRPGVEPPSWPLATSACATAIRGDTWPVKGIAAIMIFAIPSWWPRSARRRNPFPARRQNSRPGSAANATPARRPFAVVTTDARAAGPGA